MVTFTNFIYLAFVLFWPCRGPVMASSSVVRPFLEVPGLTEIRNILAQLEAPIVSALTERMNLPTDSSLYSDGGAKLLSFMSVWESISAASGRYDYGRLEYPFTLPLIPPDITTPSNSFPPGRFHQDTYSGNANITSFYLNTLVPFFNSSTSFFYHLDNSTFNPDATFNLDATLLALLSHRAHIGKVVAETKFASNVSAITQMIQTNDTSAILAAVTNTTQEASVYAQASAAAMAFSNAWLNSGALELTSFSTTLQSATHALFQELIAITTEIEVQYLLQRLD